MSRARALLCLLVLPLLAGATVPEKSVLKEVLKVSVRDDSGGARRFTLATQGLLVFSKRGQMFGDPATAPDTLTVAGVGTIELVSADDGRPLVIDVWVVGAERSETQRFSGRSLKIKRATLTSAYVVTER